MRETLKIIILTVMLVLPASLFAMPDGYSINSDSGSINADSLYRIDLATGAETRLGPVVSLGVSRIDVEGLAFAPDGTLYGVDDSALKLFPLSSTNGTVISKDEVDVRGMPTGGANDFGMTFTCDGQLYLTSVTTGSLYHAELDGSTTRIGAENSLGVAISAIAAFGKPSRLYGLSNGVGTGSLYEISLETGVASLIGPLGAAAALYNESGLAFDDEGQLWAITDRRAVSGGPFGSQVLKIDATTGKATAVATTLEQGYESLAITIPKGCADDGQGETKLSPGFNVRKTFLDGNNVSPVTLNISCNTGLPLSQSITLQPEDAVNGGYEVNFIVTDFDDGQLDCEVWEDPPPGYRPSYSCDGETTCTTSDGAGPCSFTGSVEGDANICEISNTLKSIPVDVTKLWIDEFPELNNPTYARINWNCSNAKSSGSDTGTGNEGGRIIFHESEQTETFHVYPNYDENNVTVCDVNEDLDGRRSHNLGDTGVVVDDTECQNLEIRVGGAKVKCTIINTRLYEGIPTLSQYGLLLFTILMLLTGLVAVRRF